MNAHDTNTVARFVQRIAVQPEIQQVHAVADAIGCPEWTSPEGCNRKGECFCKTAALRVAVIVREDS